MIPEDVEMGPPPERALGPCLEVRGSCGHTVAQCLCYRSDKPVRVRSTPCGSCKVADADGRARQPAQSTPVWPRIIAWSLAFALAAAPAQAREPEVIEESPEFRYVEQAAPVYGSESGCHSGASAQGYSYGASVAAASVACDAIRTVEALEAAEERGDQSMARLIRLNFLVRATVRPVLTILTLGLL